MIIQLAPALQVMKVDHVRKTWTDKDTKKENVSDNLHVSVLDPADGSFGVLRIRDPQPRDLEAFKRNAKVPPVTILRNSEEKGVQFIDVSLA